MGVGGTGLRGDGSRKAVLPAASSCPTRSRRSGRCIGVGGCGVWRCGWVECGLIGCVEGRLFLFLHDDVQREVISTRRMPYTAAPRGHGIIFQTCLWRV